MQSKRIKVLTLSLIVIAVILGLTGCGKSGTMKANVAPTIAITSYEGFDDSPLLSPYANTLFLFQQKIYWNAMDQDGVIAGFAYRIKDQNGNPIATPGNHFIDAAGTVTPQNVLTKFGPGWVLHYLPNASQDLPLDDPQARRTIWTPQKYAVINLPAADANGNPLTLLSTFEVIAVDNRGEVSQTVAWRSFNATSARPVCFISTTKGNPNGEEVGSGIRLSFSMKDDLDPFVPEVPYKYEFKMMKVHPETEVPIAGTETEWIDSVKPADPDIDSFLLTRYTSPALSYDVENNVVNSKTKFSYPETISLRSYNPNVNPNRKQLRKAAELIAQSKQPVIYAGGGVISSDSAAELTRLAEMFHLPVTTTLMGLGAFPGDHPLWLGMLGMHGTYTANMAINNCDVLISVGARFDDRVTGRVNNHT